ncbi:hypothetical protein [Dictyobacter formicarum]|uniref:DUF1249 domain-containing protein n=1 Tax=Dictyobacter formicarum TaxID=2778368 RepID=A0ABQ3VA74_9CHLR|nr:hypothetical protein [Dictyobacter formicarum]GHO82323.1 hypothetical protein KSZ_03290 [Dictyobacter formicarum]
MDRRSYSKLKHMLRTFVEENQPSFEDDRYLVLAQSIFRYIELQPEENNRRIQTCRLSITWRQQGIPSIRSIKLEDQNHSVEILRLYHHGVEELFCASFPNQQVSQQPFLRSLRNRNDEMIKQSMRWFCMTLLAMWEEDS